MLPRNYWATPGLISKSEKITQQSFTQQSLTWTSNMKTHTRMVNQGARLSICSWSDQIPDETFDIFITFVMIKTVHKDSPADGFYILFC